MIGLYKPLKRTDEPYGRHTGKPVAGFPDFDAQAHEWCSYVRATGVLGRKKKTKLEGLPVKIRDVALGAFDRVIECIEGDIGIRVSVNLARKMLRTYLGEEGYLYVGATFENVPWMVAYLSDSQSLFGQTVVSNDALLCAIGKRVTRARHPGGTDRERSTVLRHPHVLCRSPPASR